MEPHATNPEAARNVRTRRLRRRRGGLSMALVVILCSLLWPGSRSAAADWGWDAIAGVAFDDNLTNAFLSEDRKGDTAASATLSTGLHEQLGSSTGLSLGLVGSGAQFARYEGLDNVGLGVRAQVRTKFGLGAEAPWLAVAARAVHRDYRDDLRDGWDYDAAITAGKQLSERWSVRASLRYDAYVADQVSPRSVRGLSSAAYDIDGWTVGAQAAFRLTQADVVSASISWRDGSVTAVTLPNFGVLQYSDAAVVDGTFSDDRRRIAYRVDAGTTIATLTWSRALGQSATVNASYTYRSSRADHGLGTYVSNIFGIALGYSY